MKKLKLDENFPPSMVEVFRSYDIDTSSVYEQHLNGFHDDKIFDVCVIEERILITFDLDFANIIRYPSTKTCGIIIVRTKKKINFEVIKRICEKLAFVIQQNELTGRLYIVEDAKIRVRKPEE